MGKTTQFGKKILHSDICVLCSKSIATTGEHIPPEGFFITKPQDYLVVPACSLCNSGTKLDDDYARYVLAGSSHTGAGPEIWRTKIRPKLKSLPATRAGLANQLSLERIELPSGEFVPAPIFQIEGARLQRVVKKAVFGLYWWHARSMLKPDVKFTMNFYNISEASKYLERPDLMKIFRKTQAGVYTAQEATKVFFYTWAIGHTHSLWYFFYYQQNMVVAYTTGSHLRCA